MSNLGTPNVHERGEAFLDSPAQDCTLVVASCDAYSDLWAPYFALLRRYWPDCPFQIVLISETKRQSFENVGTLCLGDGLDWSSLLLRALDSVPTPYVLLSLEDFFLRRAVDTKRIVRLLREMTQQNLNMLRLIPRPGPSSRPANDAEFGPLGANIPYRVSTQAAIWRVTVLRQLLVPGESAWQFEANGSIRSSQLQGFVALRRAAFPYRHHGVERGRWFPWAAARFRHLDINADLSARPVMTATQTARWLFNKVTAGLVNRVPKTFRLRLKPLAKRLGLLG